MKRSPFLTTFDSDDEEETDLSSPEIEVDLRHINQFQVKVKGTHREIGKKQVYVSQKLSDVVNRLGSSESSTTHTHFSHHISTTNQLFLTDTNDNNDTNDSNNDQLPGCRESADWGPKNG